MFVRRLLPLADQASLDHRTCGRARSELRVAIWDRKWTARVRTSSRERTTKRSQKLIFTFHRARGEPQQRRCPWRPTMTINLRVLSGVWRLALANAVNCRRLRLAEEVECQDDSLNGLESLLRMRNQQLEDDESRAWRHMMTGEGAKQTSNCVALWRDERASGRFGFSSSSSRLAWLRSFGYRPTWWVCPVALQ